MSAPSDPAETGLPVVAIGWRSLYRAVDALAALGPDRLKGLKVRSGEHLAAILATAFVGSVPTAFDTTGEVDLRFVSRSVRHLPDEVPDGSTVAFEIKSAEGDYRKFESVIEKHPELLAERPGFDLQIKDAAGVFAAISKLIDRAIRKLSSIEAGYRCAFVIIHPFDQLANDVVQSTLAAEILPPLSVEGIDAVWVLWVPDQLTAWSVKQGRWCQMLFSAFSSDDPLDLEVRSILQDVEQRFFDVVGQSGGSPYLFEVNSDGE
jgi:hypothetical protein